MEAKSFLALDWSFELLVLKDFEHVKNAGIQTSVSRTHSVLLFSVRKRNDIFTEFYFLGDKLL